MENYSGATRKKLHIILKDAIRQAKYDRLIQENIMERVQTPKAIKAEMHFFNALPENQKEISQKMNDIINNVISLEDINIEISPEIIHKKKCAEKIYTLSF
jgi:hypothetical protein